LRVFFLRNSRTKIVNQRLSASIRKKCRKDVNIINFLRATFLYDRVVFSFSLLAVCACIIGAKGSWRKTRFSKKKISMTRKCGLSSFVDLPQG